MIRLLLVCIATVVIIPETQAKNDSCGDFKAKLEEEVGFKSYDHFRGFISELRNAVENSDFENLWADYNVKVLVNNYSGGQLSKKYYEDYEEVNENAHRIFDQETREILFNFNICDGLVNWQGVMFGRGEIWVRFFGKDDDAFYLVVINSDDLSD